MMFLSLLLLLAVAAPPAGTGTLIVLNKAEATASLIDLGTGAIVATVPTGTGPHEATVSPDGRLAVVCDYGTREAPGSTLTVIDVPAGRVARTIPLGTYRRPHGITWLQGTSRVLVTAEADRRLLTVDIESGQVTTSVETDQDTSHMVVASPDGKRAFVANIGSGSVTVIDLAAGTRLANIPTGAGAEGIAITPDGRHVWITNRAADTVSVLDAASLKILATLESKSFPIRARATPDGRYVLVSNARTGDLAVFDTREQKEVRRVTLQLAAADLSGRLFGDQFGDSSVPIGILIPPDGRFAYVAHANADVISIVDLGEWKSVGTLRAGREPDGMAYSALQVRPNGAPSAPTTAR